jgi:imidazole glycerol-phosphate synthase subunit HisH
MITIVDYGVGNLNSILNMLSRCEVDSEVTSDRDRIALADRIILPGVGAFDAAIAKLTELELIQVLKQKALDGTPMLGVCLGAQLLLDGSDEGKMSGLGLIRGRCKKFDHNKIKPLRVPHMGWADVEFKDQSAPLSSSFDEQPRFYFVHSYYLDCADDADVLATTVYGIEFPCIIGRKNIFGVQFHPEKSHKFGAQLLNNFVKNT